MLERNQKLENKDNTVSIAKGPYIAGARLGDLIQVSLITGETQVLIFTDLSQFGIEGCLYPNGPIFFFPYTSVLTIFKVVKNDEVES